MYLNRGWYYVSMQIRGKRITRSLRTKNIKIAKTRVKSVQQEMYQTLQNPKLFKDTRKETPTLPQLVELFLRDKKNIGVSAMTYGSYKYILRPWLKEGWELPQNKNTRNSYKTHLNVFFRWSNVRYKVEFELYDGIRSSIRSRVLTKSELGAVLEGIWDCGVVVNVGNLLDFQDFIRFAFYTGARRGEINNMSWDNIDIPNSRMKVEGKTGERFIKLNNQAKDVLAHRGGYLWNYKVDWISKAFQKCMFVLNIDNVVFHDIRRTFGYNLIRQGMPIFEVSKLLGHSSVVTTERHYAPLLSTDIKEFTL